MTNGNGNSQNIFDVRFQHGLAVYLSVRVRALFFVSSLSVRVPLWGYTDKVE